MRDFGGFSPARLPHFPGQAGLESPWTRELPTPIFTQGISGLRGAGGVVSLFWKSERRSQGPPPPF